MVLAIFCSDTWIELNCQDFLKQKPIFFIADTNIFAFLKLQVKDIICIKPTQKKLGIACVAIRKPERQVHKASHCGSKQQWRSHAMITVLLLVCATYIWVLFFVHIPFMVNGTINTMSTERLEHLQLNKCMEVLDFCLLIIAI